MLLDGKTAVVYGGGGAIGGAVAQAFAEQGAHVLLAGRTQSSLERVVKPLTERGLSAEAAQVDLFDSDQPVPPLDIPRFIDNAKAARADFGENAIATS